MAPISSYVLATKFDDAAPTDPFEVGYVLDVVKVGSTTRFIISDVMGAVRQPNGYGWVRQVSARRGSWIVSRIREIETSGRSLKWWLRQRMTTEEETDNGLESTRY